MSRAMVIIAIVLGGCGRKPIVTTAALAYQQYADLACAEERYGGAPPPTSQEVFCVADHLGSPVRSGDAIRYYPTGEVLARGRYVNNEAVGEWTFWHRDGALKRRETWVAGVANGEWSEYHPNGTMSANGTVQKGQRVGLWTFYDPEGHRFLEGEYTLGKEDGVWREYGPDGAPLRERVYRQGRLLRQSEI
jgi:hypothetical protein